MDKRIKIAKEILRKEGWPDKAIIPYAYRALSKIGYSTRPPVFNSFFTNMIIVGTTGCIIISFAILILFFILPVKITSIYRVFITIFGFGIFLGSVYAFYYRNQAKKLSLPRWEDLNNKP